MILVVQLSLEEDVARFAEVRFVLVVDREHVLFQMRKLRKANTADGAFKRLFAGVLADVQLEDTRVGERLPADLTSIRPFSRVNTLMNDELRSLRENRPTNGTSMRSNHLVRSHVLRQVTLEHLVANVAMEGLQVSVIAQQMLLQRIRPEETLSANMARVVPDIHVAFEVHLEIGSARECRRTIRTFVLSDSIVGGEMLRKLTTARERLRAHGTFVRFFPGVHSHVQPQPLLDGECFPTQIARVQRIGSVLGRDVVLQTASLPEPVATVRTGVRPFVVVDA